MNYFTLYDIPVSLVVDTSLLLKKYYALSKQYHPDNFTLSSIDELNESERMTATIHDAKKILENSHKRLEYILREKGIIIADEKYNLSPSFLNDMMDVNEELMELEFDKNEGHLSELKQKLDKISLSNYAEVKPYFEMKALLIDEVDAQKLKEYYYKKKYLDRIAERLI